MSGNSWPVKVARQGSGNYSGELTAEQQLQSAGLAPIRRSDSNSSLPRSLSFSGPQNYNLSFSGPLDQNASPADPQRPPSRGLGRTTSGNFFPPDGQGLVRTTSGRLVSVDSQGMVRSNSQSLLRTPSGPLSRSNSGQWELGSVDNGQTTPLRGGEAWASGSESGRLPRQRSGPIYGASQESAQERAQKRQQLPRWRTPPRSNSPRPVNATGEVELLPKHSGNLRTRPVKTDAERPAAEKKDRELKDDIEKGEKVAPVAKQPASEPAKPNGGLLDRPEEEDGVTERTPLNVDMMQDLEGMEMGGAGSALLTDELKRYLFGAGEDRLLELVARFYDTLMDYGLVDTAIQLTSELVEERAVAADLEEDRDLAGIEKLLKHGLLEFLMRIAPLLKPLPAQVIKFKDVIYAARIRPEIEGGITVASSFERAFLGRFRDAVLPRPHKIIPMLDRITGFLMPGSLTLVLGPPGCGKTALHQVLSGRAMLDKNTEKAGEITYNGKPLSQLNAKRIAAYVAEQREHLANLTVRETCEFARDCTDSGDHKNKDAVELKELVGDAIAEGQDPRLEVVLQLLGLTPAGNTLLGKGARGLSTAERLRVTSAEMLAGTYAAYFFDDFTTGLDNGTLYDIVAAIRTMARVFGTTNLFSLQQPPPEVFDLFDRLILLHEGRVVYQGPREDVLSYFQSLGYIKPPLCNVTDFLQEVTTGAGELFLLPGFPKLSSDGFAQAYEMSEYCQEVKRVVDSPETNLTFWTTSPHPLGLHLQDTRVGKGALVANLDEEANLRVCSMTFTAPPLPGDQVTGVSGPNGKLEYLALKGIRTAAAVEERIERSREPVRLQLERPLPELAEQDRREYEKEYVQGFFKSAATVARRQWAIGSRDLYLTLSRLFLALLLAVITGTIFWQVTNSPSRESYDLRRAVMFAAVLIPVLNSLASVSAKFDERQVLYKQRDARFFRVVPYVIADTLVGVPFSIFEVVFFAPFVYFFSGLTATGSGSHFFIFLLVVFLVSLVGAALVRLMVTISPTKNRATAATGLVLALAFVFSGFFVVRAQVPKGWIWAYYASPLQWAQTSLVLNEFLSSKYDAICAAQQLAIATYCQTPDEQLGRSYLQGYDYPVDFNWVWYGVAALAGFYLLFIFATAFALQRVRFKPKRGRPPTDRKEAAQLGSTSPEHPLSVKYLANQANEPAPLEKIDIRNGGVSGEFENKTMIKPPGILEYVPVTLSFHNIHYDVPVPGTSPDAPKVLLRDVSGFAKPGYITAIMGAPGAGKRILLDVLAGQQTGHITGDILVNGFDRVESTFKRISGYVALQDTLSPFLTVEETLRFSARLRLPSNTLKQHLQAFVVEVMEILELLPIRNFLVGTPTQVGLGIEQIKRVSIATELAANPSIIFFDEPTAGLDSRGAQRLMRGIRNIANTGRTIVMTSHQPGARLFSAFDMLLLLKFGGETVFFGPIGPDGENVVNYFEAIPGTVACGENQNPASYIMEVIGAGITRVAHREYSSDYKKSELYDVNAEELDTLRWSKGEAGPDFSEEGYAAPPWRRQGEVTKRAVRTFWRNVSNSFGRALMGILLALILGSLCFKVGQDTTSGMVSRVGVIYLAVLLFGLMNAVFVVMAWNREQPMYMRERHVSAYSALNYSLAWGTAELPFLLVISFIFTIIVYGMADIALTSGVTFLTSLTAVFLYTLAMVYFGLLVAEVALNAKVAALILTFFTTLWSLTSGYLVNRGSIPDFYIWLFWLNPLQYAFNCLGSVAFYCNTSTPECITAGCLIDANACPKCFCPRLLDHPNFNRITWPVVQGEWNFTYDRRGYDLLALIAFIALFKALAILAFRIFAKRRKL